MFSINRTLIPLQALQKLIYRNVKFLYQMEKIEHGFQIPKIRIKENGKCETHT